MILFFTSRSKRVAIVFLCLIEDRCGSASGRYFWRRDGRLKECATHSDDCRRSSPHCLPHRCTPPVSVDLTVKKVVVDEIARGLSNALVARLQKAEAGAARRARGYSRPAFIVTCAIAQCRRLVVELKRTRDQPQSGARVLAKRDRLARREQRPGRRSTGEGLKRLAPPSLLVPQLDLTGNRF